MRIDGVPRCDGSGVLAVASPVGSRLRIHATLVRIAVSHVWIRVRRVLSVRIGRTRCRDGRIYGYIVVRPVRLGLMASFIMLGHRRTVWLLLRHTSSVACGTGRMILAMQLVRI
jgi:hypothetical protein